MEKEEPNSVWKPKGVLRCHSWAKLPDDPFGKTEEMNFRGISTNDHKFE